MRARGILLMVIGFWAATSDAQTPSPEGTLFDTVRPDVIITIKKHQTGADIVEIQCREDGYPENLLKAQAEDVGTRLGIPIRGLRLDLEQIPAAGSTMSFLRCSFGATGILDTTNQRILLKPICQAFAGDHGKFTVHGLSILLDGEVATERDVRRYRSETADVDGIRIDQPPGLEYRILLKTTEPDKIFIPSWSGEQPPANAAPPPAQKSDPTWIVLIVIGAIAIGALVYSFLLRKPKST